MKTTKMTPEQEVLSQDTTIVALNLRSALEDTLSTCKIVARIDRADVYIDSFMSGYRLLALAADCALYNCDWSIRGGDNGSIVLSVRASRVVPATFQSLDLWLDL